MKDPAVAQPEKLWSKSLILLMIINFIGALVFYLLMVELVSYCVDEFGVSTSLAAMPITVYVISALVARIVLGHQVDKWGPKTSLVLGVVINLISCIGYLLPMGFGGLLVWRAFHGIGLALSSAAAAAGAVLMIPPSRGAEGIGYFSMAQALGTGVGPLISVLLTTYTSGYSAMFVFSAGISVVAVLLSLGVKLPRVKVEDTHLGRPKISDLVQVSAIPVCLVTALIFFCYSGVSSYAVGFASQQGFSTISAFFMVYAIVIVVSRPIAGKRVDAKGENSTIYLTMALLVVGLAMMALAPNGAIFLASAAALGVGVGVTQSIVQAIVAREAQPSEQGRANSTFMMSLDIGSGLGPMPLGALLGFVTYRQMYGLLAAIAVITIVVYYLAHGRKAR